ncbi:putative transcription regulator Others family [Medicago truncatula]|uniref:Putative transcription regulator Others family n=1 Tax=Medicago truncatula TaxID=3880 RepID=A0A396GZV2_MEDTR|nr:paired amphipathic helix protein Sin3-like 1 [Medicago truncatula]RHN44385.1 putative transcription regulator Others family [Medicago truncatula]
MEGHSRKHCEVKKAKEFLNEVKHRFIQDNRRDKYDDFLKVLKDYKTKRIDDATISKLLNGLFEGHRDLISRLNYFMPDGFKIKLPKEEEESLEHSEEKNAKEFVNDVKCRFIQVNQRDKCDNFLNVLNDYKTQRIDAANLSKLLKGLFEGHRDLILRLNYYMPDGYAIKLPSEEEQSLEHCEAKNAKEFLNEVKCRFIQVNQREKNDNFLNVLKDYRTQRIDDANLVIKMKKIFEGHSDLISRLNYFLPDGYEIKLPLEEEQVHVKLEDAKSS